MAEAAFFYYRKRSQVVEQPRNHGNINWKQKLPFGFHHLVVGKRHKVSHIVRGQPTVFRGRRLETEKFAEFKDRFPEKIVVRNDQTGMRTTERLQSLKARLDVVQIADNVRQNYIVVGGLRQQVEPLGVGLLESEARICLVGELCHTRADINADAI